MLAPPSTGLSGQICLDFPKQSPAPPRREGSRDLDEKSSDLAKDLSKSSFRAHLVRAAACWRRETTPTCTGSFKAFWLLRYAAPCTFRPATAQIAGSLRDLAIAPLNLGLKPSLARSPSCPDARARREITPTCTGPFGYFRVLRCVAPWAPCALRGAARRVMKQRK